MILRLLNESVACLREGIVDDADLLDAGIIFGTGFAPFRGGPMQYIKERRASELHEKLKQFNHLHGKRFLPDAGWEKLIKE
jgi:3-hydroxyacyl-CoA dehydrogenase / enoyl-CoA hydratase / 3-hydroxybutyryl-CoA epimerase